MAKNPCNTATQAARWMDKNYPGWAKKIDTNRLCMVSYSDCILGQVIGNSDKASDKFAESFNYSGKAGTAFYDSRQKNAWLVEINKRLAKAQTKPATNDIAVAVDSINVTIGGVSVNLTQDKLKGLISQLQKFVV